MIRSVQVYQTKGKQFDRYSDAVKHRENLIEEFLRKLPGFQDMPAKARIDFVQSIIDRRHDLIDLLSYDDKPEDDNDNY